MSLQDGEFREKVVERLTGMEGQLNTLALQLESGDNAIRQLLRFDKERFERIEKALESVENALRNSATKLELDAVKKRVNNAEERIDELEEKQSRGLGQKDVWLRIWAWVGPVLGAIVTAWAVRSLF